MYRRLIREMDALSREIERDLKEVREMLEVLRRDQTEAISECRRRSGEGGCCCGAEEDTSSRCDRCRKNPHRLSPDPVSG